MIRILLLSAMLFLGLAAEPGLAQMQPRSSATQLIPGSIAPAQSQAAPPATQTAAQTSAASAAPAPPPAQMGRCQCLADIKGLDFTCPESAGACETSCGKLYSFVPSGECTGTGQ
jgi:hypothetical protein